MIGCGGNSSGHARRMNSNPDVQIVGTCDVNTDIANSYIDRNLSDLKPRPDAYDDIAKMLSETKPDAVVISTPHTLHFEQGMQASGIRLSCADGKADGHFVGRCI